MDRQSIDMQSQDNFTTGDRRELIKQSLILEQLVTSLNEMKMTHNKISENVETRVRALENFRWFLLGMSSLVSVIMTLAMKLLKL